MMNENAMDIEGMKPAEGGVCAPAGFVAGGIHCGIRAGSDPKKRDLSIIYSETPCSAAAVYTTNKVKGAPLVVTREHLADGKAQAIVCNSGNANTCAPGGEEVARETCRLTAESLGLRTEDIIVASTGVIGEELSLAPFEQGIPALQKILHGTDADGCGSKAAAEGIMTTDTIPKEVAVRFELDGVSCHIGGIAKGSGMIHPNMATMLAFLTTDVDIAPDLLRKALGEAVKDSFNQISVDGDTSTNDMVALLAGGRAGNRRIIDEGTAFEQFCRALAAVMKFLARRLAEDGEGASKLITCHVTGAPSKEMARTIARTVVSSNLLKAAVFGEDANWGRVLCAIGYAPGDFNTENIDVAMESERGRVKVCQASRYHEHSEEEAAQVLSAHEIIIAIDMHQGTDQASAWGCDLTYDYVKINGDYRT